MPLRPLIQNSAYLGLFSGLWSCQFIGTRFIQCPVADGQHVNSSAGLINFVNGAVDVRLISVEQMAKRPFRPSALRRDGTAPREVRKGIDRLFEAVEPPRRGLRFRRIYLRVKKTEIAFGTNCKFNGACHADGESR
jgi:hypothetical protein